MSITPVVYPSTTLPPTQVLPEGKAPKPYKYFYSDHKASDAALRFLLDHDPEGLDQLIGICVIACKGLYFHNAWEPYTRDGSKMVGQQEVVRDFIVGWLGNELSKCKDWFADDIQLAEPKLRHIPRRCRLAVIAKIRKCPSCGPRKTKECLDCDYIFSHRDINRGAKACPKCGSGDTHVVCRHKCPTPSERTSIDASYSDAESETRSKLSDYLVERGPQEYIFVWLALARPLLEQIHPKLYVYLKVAFTHFKKSGYKRYLTTQFAAHEGVSLKVARNLKKEILTAFRENLDKPIVQELYQRLEHDQDPNIPHLAIPMSKRTKDAIEAKREASRLLRECRKEMGLKSSESLLPPPEPTWADYDPPTSGQDAECSSATTFLSVDGGLREIAAQDILAHQIQDVGEEDDIRAYFGVGADEPIPLDIDTECMRGEDISYDENTGYDVGIET